jgi:alkylated DNA nucleotide flippase Atl1
MWTCKQVGRALAEQRYQDLPWHRRIGLKLHVALCVVCHRYNKSVMQMQDIAADFQKHEQAGDIPSAAPALSDEAKKRICDSLKQNNT